MAIQQYVQLGEFPSLIIPAGEHFSSKINFSLDFNITNNDSIRIIKFILYSSTSLPNPLNWAADISYYSSSWGKDVYTESMSTTLNSMIEIPLDEDDIFSLNHKQYSLSLSTLNNNTYSQDIGLLSSFTVEVVAEMTINTKPTITSGKIITPFEMATLASYKNIIWNYSNKTITASDGNKIKSNTLSTGTPITASWYNS